MNQKMYPAGTWRRDVAKLMSMPAVATASCKTSSASLGNLPATACALQVVHTGTAVTSKYSLNLPPAVIRHQ